LTPLSLTGGKGVKTTIILGVVIIQEEPKKKECSGRNNGRNEKKPSHTHKKKGEQGKPWRVKENKRN